MLATARPAESEAGADLPPPAPGSLESTLARIARLAAATTGAATGAVTLVHDGEARIAAAHGLPPWAKPGAPLDVPAAGSQAVLDAPFRDADGRMAGQVIVLDAEPRAWTDDDAARLADLAALAERELRLRGQIRDAQQLEAVRRLVSDVAHDVNNLLAVIGASARLVRETVHGALPASVAGDAEADLDGIESAVRRAGALARQLLTFGRSRHSVLTASITPTRTALAPSGSTR